MWETAKAKWQVAETCTLQQDTDKNIPLYLARKESVASNANV